MKNSFYDDDGLVSCKTVDEGGKAVNELRLLLKSCGIDPKKTDPLKDPIFLCEHENKFIVTPLEKYCSEMHENLVCINPDSAVLTEIDFNFMCNMIQRETNLYCAVPVYKQLIARKCSQYFECLKVIVYRYRYIIFKLHKVIKIARFTSPLLDTPRQSSPRPKLRRGRQLALLFHPT